MNNTRGAKTHQLLKISNERSRAPQQCTPAVQGMAAGRSLSTRPAFFRGSHGVYSGVLSDAEAWQTRLKSGFRGCKKNSSYHLVFRNKSF